MTVGGQHGPAAWRTAVRRPSGATLCDRIHTADVPEPADDAEEEEAASCRRTSDPSQ